jgi:hypothetical protein
LLSVRPVCREHMEHRRKMEEEAAAAKGALNIKNNELRKKLQNVQSRLCLPLLMGKNAPAKK